MNVADVSLCIMPYIYIYTRTLVVCAAGVLPDLVVMELARSCHVLRVLDFSLVM